MVDEAPANTNDTVLRCAGIERSFAGLKALKGVSLDVHRGEIFGLVGPNGSGKTTMVNVVTGFYPPNAGSVTSSATTLPVWRRTLSLGGSSTGNGSQVMAPSAVGTVKTPQPFAPAFDLRPVKGSRVPL